MAGSPGTGSLPHYWGGCFSRSRLFLGSVQCKISVSLRDESTAVGFGKQRLEIHISCGNMIYLSWHT